MSKIHKAPRRDRKVRQIAVQLLIVAASLAASGRARAQDQNVNSFNLPGPLGPGIVGQFDPGSATESATISTGLTPATCDQPAILWVHAKIAPNKHAYAIPQPPGGPHPTKINLVLPKDHCLLAPFAAGPAPHARVEAGPVWTGLKMEEHEGEVTWYVPIEVTAGVDPRRLEISGVIHVEVCETGGSCEMINKDFVAHVTPGDSPNIRIADWPPTS